MGFFSELVDGFVAGVNGVAQNNGQEPGRIERLCRELGWPVDERDGQSVYLYFNDNSGGDQRVVMIHDGDDVLALFSCASNASLALPRVPPEVYSYLLNRNCEIALGAWQVRERKDGMASFAITYEALGPGLNAGALKFICTKMVNEVVDFDRRMKSAALLR